VRLRAKRIRYRVVHGLRWIPGGPLEPSDAAAIGILFGLSEFSQALRGIVFFINLWM